MSANPSRLRPETSPEAPSNISESLARKAAILDAVGDSVIATDLAGRVVYWNDAAGRLFGWESREAIGRPVVELTLPAEAATDADAIVQRLRRGHSWTGEVVLRTRDGRTFPGLVTSAPIRDASGKLVGMVAVSRDTTAHRHTEEALRETERRLDLVHRATPTVLWEWEPGTEQIRWSDAFAATFGYEPDQVEASYAWWESRIDPADRERVTQGLWEAVISGRQFWTEEYGLQTGDGTVATVFHRAYVAHEPTGRPPRVVGSLVDLTEQRRQHEAQRLLSQVGMLLDLSLDYRSTLPGIARLAVGAVADFCLIMVRAEDPAFDLVVAEHADPRLQPVVEEMGHRLRDQVSEGQLLARVFQDGESILVRGTLVEATGEEIPDRLHALSDRLAPHSTLIAPMTSRGMVQGLVALGRVEGHRAYSEQDLALAEELARRIGLSVDNARLVESAALANRAKSDFLAVMSHELRTPLTAVLGCADLLHSGVAGPLTAPQRRQVERIQRGTDRLRQLLERILAFARLETGRESTRHERVELKVFLDHLDAMIRPRASEKGLRFRLDAQDAPEAVVTDPDKLSLILLSLLTNALKFTDSGGVELRVYTDGSELRFDVADSGPGIAAEHLSHVFNPFWQAETVNTRRIGGAGLGLSLARRLARLLNGDVAIAASSPAGTTVRLHLPLNGPA